MHLTVVPNPIDNIDGITIVHVRHIVKRLELPENYGAETRIQIGNSGYYCVEMPATVAARVSQERVAAGLRPLSELTLPGGKPVWFAGEQAVGPIHLSPGEIGDGIHSAFSVGDLVTRVRNMPDEVAAVIKAAGGKPKRPARFAALKEQLPAVPLKPAA